MSVNTPIQWCDDTINPTMGCDGCELSNDETRMYYKGTHTLANVLGAKAKVGPHITVYLPDKDRLGLRVPDHAAWVNRGHKLLGLIGGGCTETSTHGSWSDENGRLIRERTVKLETFTTHDRLETMQQELCGFLRSFGLQTNQSELLVTIDEKRFSIPVDNLRARISPSRLLSVK